MRSGQKEERGEQGVTKLQRTLHTEKLQVEGAGGGGRGGVQICPARLWLEALCEAPKGGRGYTILHILTAMHVLC